MTIKAFAALSPSSPLVPFDIERRSLGSKDVRLEVLHCGVCHSDLHAVRGEWPGQRYPMVPGHEIVGRVTHVGDQVARHQVGDLVGVGCMVDSDRTCPSCRAGLEQYCDDGFVNTYGGHPSGRGENTYGGYSAAVVVDEHFVLKVAHPERDLAAVAPLLCAGVTTWSPLRHWKIGPGSKVGIVGIGGLGHMGVKLAAALGAHVVAFTTSESKRQDAFFLGAHEVVISSKPDEMAVHSRSLDLILDTVAASHDLDVYVAMLKVDGVLVLNGVPENPHPSPAIYPLLTGRRSISGSAIGNITETQELLDFCARENIIADIEPISMHEIDTAFERMLHGDVKYRFVIDMTTL
ncbi:NAD(P)-dependent alcohol dehydrogenase [Sphingomonas arantia]|uniref:NAD(P)-dependent alcohol dehydrogenase n=1 Tax=Sphingomonas arantia TaxID=1460676 RepID=A0ABW4TXV3_9SPHN